MGHAHAAWYLDSSVAQRHRCIFVRGSPAQGSALFTDLVWKKNNDNIFRVLEDSADGDTGCRDTSDDDEQHT